MAFKIWVTPPTAYNVTVYSRAGDNPNTNYDLYYSPDNSNWTLLAANLSSLFCNSQGTVSISSGIIYIKAQQSSNAANIYGRGSNSSTCPANVPLVCTYQAIITGNEDVAYTVYVDGSGDYQLC